MKRLSQRIRNRIAELAAAGMTTRDIAKKYKCSVWTVYKYTKKMKEKRKYVKLGVTQLTGLVVFPPFTPFEKEIIRQSACMIAEKVCCKINC